MIHKVLLSTRKSYSKKALFLDRDGVINKNPPEHDYVKNWSEFRFNNRIFGILRKATKCDYKIIVVTNQRGIARKFYTRKEFLNITKKMNLELKKDNIYLNAVYYCPHNLDDGCECRKPKPGLFIKAFKDFNIDPKVSIMLGDSVSDEEAAKASGIKNTIIANTNLKHFDVNIVLKELMV